MARSHFHSVLIERITNEVDKVAADLAQGSAASYEKYREQVGYVKGMADALKLADEIEQDSNKQ